MVSQRWVALDVGETLIDETRVWSVWADELKIPRLTFMAALGAVIARGGEHREVFGVFEIDDWPMRLESIESIYGGFTADDLYPDALRAIERLRADGYRIAVVANQPAVSSAELRAAGVEADVMAMSEELGVKSTVASKRSPRGLTPTPVDARFAASSITGAGRTNVSSRAIASSLACRAAPWSLPSDET